MGLVIALVCFGVLRVLKRRVNPKGKGKVVVSIARLVVALTAGCGLAYCFAGRWMASAVSWVSGLPAALTGEPGWKTGLPLAITVVVLLTVAADLAYDRKADRGAIVGAVLLPTLLLLVVGGALGQTGGDAVRAGYQAASTLMATLGGA